MDDGRECRVLVAESGGAGMTTREWDLLCLGRAAVDLYCDQLGAELEHSSTFSKYLGGCPANVAVGAARLGLKTAMLSRVGDEAMGRFVCSKLEEEGVDTRLVETDPSRLTGLVLLGVCPPDHFPLIFYRENCADMAIEKSQFTKEDLARSKALLLTGTHFSSPEMSALSMHAAALAKETQTKLILDIDYRPVLWGLTGHGDGEERFVASAKVSETLEAVLPMCDLIVGTEEELRIASNESSVDSAVGKLQQTSTQAVIVRKCGEEGCIVYEAGQSSGHSFKPNTVEVLNVLGAGDAFLSGFLRGWLREEGLATCALWGNACGALVVSRHACSADMPYWEEMQLYLEEDAPKSRKLQSLQRDRRVKETGPLNILALDHRQYFKDMGCTAAQVSRFKELVLNAAISGVPGGSRVGVILDAEYGAELFGTVDEVGLWSASPIERTAAYPVSFFGNKTAHEILRRWPKHRVVKVLTYALDLADPIRMVEQVERLKELQSACEEWGQQWLLEVISGQRQDSSDIVASMNHYRAAGLSPDWWKIPSSLTADEWDQVQELVAQDSACQGVLVLGGDLSVEQLTNAAEALRHRDCIRGFAIGRAILGGYLKVWLDGELSDAAVVEGIKDRFEQVRAAWSGRLMTV